MYGGGPIIARTDLDIYSPDPVLEKAKQNSPKRGGIMQREAKVPVNIFQRKSVGSQEESKKQESSSEAQQRKKKRNLFASENIRADADEGVPEEHDAPANIA